MNAAHLRSFLSALALTAVAGTALGQNALGGGRALDGGLSTQPGGRINASTQDLQSIVRFNTNAGNALNGPGFINSRAPLGGSATLNSTSSLLNTSSSFNSSIISRARSFDSGSRSGLSAFDSVAALEAGYLSSGSLTSAVTLPQGTVQSDYSRANDQSVGFMRDRQGEVWIARGSSTRGITIEPLNPPALDPTLATGPRTGADQTYSRVLDDLRRASAARALENPNRIDNSASPATAPNTQPATANTGNTATPVNNAAKPNGPLQYDPDATINRLRERLAAANAKPATKPGTPAPRPTIPTPGAPDPSNASSTSSLSEEDINALRAMGIRLETLIPPGTSDAAASDSFTKLGQEALNSGQFGLADQMFESALSRSSQNVLAQVGAVHATMGMGLLMTGGNQLRAFYTEHPEMIPVRFDSGIVMPKARAERLADMLTSDIDRADGSLLGNSGLTLAYLGRQFDNPAWLNKGLTAMGTQTKDDPQGTELLNIVTKVWSTSAAPATPSK